MDPGFTVGANQQVKAHSTGKPVEQEFEEKLTSYVKSTSRVPPEPKEIRDAFTQLKSQKLNLQTFCKTLLNSTNTNDLSMVAQLAEKLNIPILKDEVPQQPRQPKPGEVAPNKFGQSQDTKPLMPNPMSNLTIIQTSVNEHILTEQVVKLIKQGNSKEALNTLESKAGLLGKVIDAFGNLTQLSSQDMKGLLAFMAGVLASTEMFPPDVLEQLKKKYEKLRKLLEEAEGTEEDADTSKLSEDAKKFVKSFRALSHTVQQWEGDMPQELADAYSELLAKLGMKEDIL